MRHSVNRGAIFCDGLKIEFAVIAKVEPSFIEYDGDDPVSFVVSV